MFSADDNRFEWVRGTRFGFDVVPDVYKRSAASSVNLVLTDSSAVVLRILAISPSRASSADTVKTEISYLCAMVITGESAPDWTIKIFLFCLGDENSRPIEWGSNFAKSFDPRCVKLKEGGEVKIVLRRLTELDCL